MDEVLKAASLVCKVVVGGALVFLAGSTYWLWLLDLPYQQPGLVIVMFTLPMVVLIAVVDVLLHLTLNVETPDRGMKKPR